MPRDWVPSGQQFLGSVYPLEARFDVPRASWHDSYPADVPPGFTSPPLRTEQLLRLAAGQFPQRAAIKYFRTEWTYSELLARVQQVAANLQHVGLMPGDRALLVLPNCPDFVAIWFALHWLGVEVVPANPLMTSTELFGLARKCEVRAVIALDVRLRPVAKLLHDYFAPVMIVSSLSPHLPWPLRCGYGVQRMRLGRVNVPPGVRVVPSAHLYARVSPPLVEPVSTEVNQSAVLQPTGGTTGTPKVAMLTHANLHANVAQLHVWSGLTPGNETVLAVLPFFHVFGATVALLSAIAGGSTLLLQARFDVKRVFRTIEQHRPGVAPMVPFMFVALCEEMRRRRNLQGLKLCFCGAAPLDDAIRREFQERTGATVIEGYGLSEASPVTHSNPPDHTARPGTIGLPLPGTEVRIVDPETGVGPLPVGTVGELTIRGPLVMAANIGDPHETARALRNGWLFTGDLGSMNEQGFFQLVDRKKDLILTGGLNVYPAQVEAVLRSHPSVLDCAVVGLPDPRYGECVAAYVVPVKGVTVCPAELQVHCRQVLASYKVPRIIETRQELPRNFLGKVRRVELRSKAA